MSKSPLLISALCTLLSALSYAQGVLPPKKEAVKADEPVSPYILVGTPVPATLTVLDSNGKPRTLMSYKVPAEALVLGFFSPNCALNQEQWIALRRFYAAYKGWHVGFLGVSVKAGESPEELAQAMSKAGLPYSVVRDDQGRLASALHATVTPEIVIIDEFDQLRYRGPLKYASKALDAIIGQDDMKVNPEPPDLEGCPIP